jgi:hypothetical protein
MSRPTLIWYSHRYGGNPVNLTRAKERFAVLAPHFAKEGKILHAPWFALADAGIEEDRALAFCRGGVIASDLLFLDLDGEEQSPGMQFEHQVAAENGVEVSWIRKGT